MQNVTVTPGNTIVLAQSVDYTFTLMLTNLGRVSELNFVAIQPLFKVEQLAVQLFAANRPADQLDLHIFSKPVKFHVEWCY
jgi:hypothetical protein